MLVIIGSFRLTFKTGKTDCKIVRSMLQAHGFLEVCIIVFIITIMIVVIQYSVIHLFVKIINNKLMYSI